MHNNSDKFQINDIFSLNKENLSLFFILFLFFIKQIRMLFTYFATT